MMILLLISVLFAIYISRNPIPPATTPATRTRMAAEIGSTRGPKISCAWTALNPLPPTAITLETSGFRIDIWFKIRITVNPTIIAPCIIAAPINRLVHVLSKLLALLLEFIYCLRQNSIQNSLLFSKSTV